MEAQELEKALIDCRHYDDELGCCRKLSDWCEPMPVLQPCVKSPCEHYEKKCEFCREGDEKCGTCEGKYKEWDESCASDCDEEKCVAYKPVNYCFMCGRKLKGGAE